MIKISLSQGYYEDHLHQATGTAKDSLSNHYHLISLVYISMKTRKFEMIYHIFCIDRVLQRPTRLTVMKVKLLSLVQLTTFVQIEANVKNPSVKFLYCLSMLLV